jgi:hypothetical protein
MIAEAVEEHSALVYKWRLLPHFWSIMGFIPLGHQLLPCAWLHPINGSILFTIISKEVCRVFVLRCQSTLQVICLVSSHQVHLSHTVYSRTNHIHVFIHSITRTFIHPFIHSFMHYYFHSYAAYTQHHSYITILINHNLVWLYPFSLIFTHCCVKQIACKDLLLPLCQANNLQRSFVTSVSSW